ncbi:proclotting enzyme [Trichonephila clavata]|uniref:CLIP domain-containing serine protease n=1 Tax=Trichonephila clavata TaxID=2740835 RepID=A0A8X6LMV2_TRICU|nr:proclotting enzyme [Trichonephila clavata]
MFRLSFPVQLILLLAWIAVSNGQIRFVHDDRSNSLSDADCLTPRRERGRCIRWTECPSLRRTTSWNSLQPYVCGFSSNEPKVCCGLVPSGPLDRSDFIFPTTSTKRPTRTPVGRGGGGKPSFLPENCGVTRYPHTRVVGGKQAEKGSWPWMAVIFVEKRNNVKSPDCGGALVTTRHVITAAHCVVTGRSATTMSPRLLTVRLGAHDLKKSNEPGALDISVSAVRRHEQFDPRTYKNDIAVLRLSRTVRFHDDISPVCLPFDSLYNYNLTGKISYVTGFGTTAFNGPSSDVLMEVGFDIQSQDLCRKAYERELNITEEYLCAGMMDGSKDSCQGDSGGPLVAVGKENKYYLVGVVSFGKLCAQPGYPGVYTRVTKYLDWLRTNLAD